MQTEHKIAIFAISSALAAVLVIVAYNVYDANLREKAYADCLAANKAMVEANIQHRTDIRILPTCYRW